jgi:hypothetical protein
LSAGYNVSMNHLMDQQESEAFQTGRLVMASADTAIGLGLVFGGTATATGGTAGTSASASGVVLAPGPAKAIFVLTGGAGVLVTVGGVAAGGYGANLAANGSSALPGISVALSSSKPTPGADPAVVGQHLPRDGVPGGRNRGPKNDENAPQNNKVRAEAEKLQADGHQIVAGGRIERERLIQTPGGLKDGRRPDILYLTPSGELRGRNVGSTRADGSPVKRELEALDDLNGPGKLPTGFVPYDR